MFVKQVALPDDKHVLLVEAKPSVDLGLGMQLFVDLVHNVG